MQRSAALLYSTNSIRQTQSMNRRNAFSVIRFIESCIRPIENHKCEVKLHSMICAGSPFLSLVRDKCLFEKEPKDRQTAILPLNAQDVVSVLVLHFFPFQCERWTGTSWEKIIALIKTAEFLDVDIDSLLSELSRRSVDRIINEDLP